MEKPNLKIDFRKLPQKGKVEAAINALWEKYEKSLSTTGGTWDKERGQFVTGEVKKKDFEFAIKTYIGNKKDPKASDIKQAVRKYQLSSFYTNYKSRQEFFTLKDLYTKDGVFFEKGYKKFQTKILRSKTGRFEKYNAANLKYEKSGYFTENGERRHYREYRYNDWKVIIIQSPDQIRIERA